MKRFIQRFAAFLFGSFGLLLLATLAVNVQSRMTFMEMLPGVIVILACSIVASLVCAAVIRAEGWWVILVPQSVAASLLLLIFALL